MDVLFVTSELYPLIKTGGLADVAGALPPALALEDCRVRTLLPGYRRVMEALGETELVTVLEDHFGGDTRLLKARAGELDLLILDAPGLYDRPGNPYVDADGKDWPDNATRFAALSAAAAQIGHGLIGDWRPDLIHAHDWQAGLTPAYLATAGGKRPATVITVHNLAFQGQFPAEMLKSLRLPASMFQVAGLEYYGQIGFLKAGLFYADKITTVSPTYAQEIQTAEQGMGLDGLLRGRSGDLVGIVNGVDEQVWDPATDRHLKTPYTFETIEKKTLNKKALQERFGLDTDPDRPLFIVITRLTWQKGMDLLAVALPNLVASGAHLALLGSGEAVLEKSFRDAASDHPGQVGCILGYDEPLSHLMQGGADAILIPSRFEPCGLTQLYGLRYGTLPVVARVGGLADTVIDANEAGLRADAATGVQFTDLTPLGLSAAIDRTVALFAQKPVWRAMQKRAMVSDVGWQSSAKAYKALYREAIEGRQAV
ncbi:MAG: glycogen synthase GlgA [Geminicoccaceae bacterium]